MGFVDPCTQLLFNLSYNIPAGASSAIKYEWYVNGVLIKLTTSISDKGFAYTINSKVSAVQCKVTYQNTNNTTVTKTSNIFTPTVKDLNFDQINSPAPFPNYGCTSNLVTFSLNTYTCTSLCNAVYNVTGPYTISWQPPSGWVQSSISTNGNVVSFTPDIASGGTLTATIHLPCGYSDTRTFAINQRPIPAPTFAPANVQTCGSSASMAITPICGAVNYTYSIVGNPGVTFTSNGLQTLTTTNTTLNFSITGGNSVNTIKAKANYPNSVASSDATATLTAGARAPGNISTLLADGATGKIIVQIAAVPGAISYNWYLNGVATNNHGVTATISIGRNHCGGYEVSVEAISACGTSSKVYQEVDVPCFKSFTLSPNPANSTIIISPGENKMLQSSTVSYVDLTFDQIRIYDFQKNLKKQIKFNKVKSATIDISMLPAGTYYIEISGKNFMDIRKLQVVK